MCYAEGAFSGKFAVLLVPASSSLCELRLLSLVGGGGGGGGSGKIEGTTVFRHPQQRGNALVSILMQHAFPTQMTLACSMRNTTSMT
jgi:hypothetical protein